MSSSDIAVPVVDVGALTRDADESAVAPVAAEIDRAATEVGFFGVVGHGVDPAVIDRLARAAHEFFALPTAAKESVAMAHGGRAWRGWFPLHGELTSGTPDHKEGYYFGRELATSDRRVASALPLHGPNLFPAVPADLRPAVLAYLDALEDLGHRLTRALSVALGLAPDELGRRWFSDPVILLRLFRYPPAGTNDPVHGVAEHTDYGFLTLLWQDESGGLEVRRADRWRAVPPIPDAFVCNIGDMLDRLTGGRYRSTPHRVHPPRDGDRISIPFFFDPDWDARLTSLAPVATDAATDAADRWDGTSVHTMGGTYGEYLVAKVGQVFPALAGTVLDG